MASLRKHITQMTHDEIEFLLNKAKEVKNWRLSKHLLERIEERYGSRDSVLETLHEGNLIEYHQKDGTSRILMRGTKVYGKDVACVVFQFEDEKVITLYWNKEVDHHRTLKEEAYDEKLDVIELFEQEQLHRESNKKRPVR